MVSPGKKARVTLAQYSEGERAVIDKYLERKKDLPPHFKGAMENGVPRLEYDDPKEIGLQMAKIAAEACESSLPTVRRDAHKKFDPHDLKSLSLYICKKLQP